MSAEMADTLQQMLQVDPSRRATLQQLYTTEWRAAPHRLLLNAPPAPSPCPVTLFPATAPDATPQTVGNGMSVTSRPHLRPCPIRSRVRMYPTDMVAAEIPLVTEGTIDRKRIATLAAMSAQNPQTSETRDLRSFDLPALIA